MPTGEDEALVLRVLSGDEHAWPLLWRRVAPKLMATLRRPSFLPALDGGDDECRAILGELRALVAHDDFARLRAWHAARDGARPVPMVVWLLVVARRVAIERRRARGDAAPADDRDAAIAPTQPAGDDEAAAKAVRAALERLRKKFGEREP